MRAVIVKLPTAAPRKVKNWRFKEQRQAGLQLRKEHADRFNYIFPWQREAARMVDFMLDGGMTAERRLLIALLDRMDDDAYAEILRKVSDSPDAVCLAKMAKGTVGLRASLEHEMSRRGLT